MLVNSLSNIYKGFPMIWKEISTKIYEILKIATFWHNMSNICRKTSFCTSKINFLDRSLMGSKLIEMHFWALLDQILCPNFISKLTLKQNKIDNFTHLAIGLTHLALGIRHIFGAKKRVHFAKHLFRNGWMGLPPTTNDKKSKLCAFKNIYQMQSAK